MSAWPLQEMERRIGETQPPLSFGTSLGIGLAALLVVNFPGTWAFIRYFTTMAHEGSHVVMRSLLGFKITGVELKLKNAAGELGSMERALTCPHFSSATSVRARSGWQRRS